MSFVNQIYQNVFRRTSTFAFAVIAGAFFFERAFDQGGDYMFEYMNKGKLYKDLKEKFATYGEGEEE